MPDFYDLPDGTSYVIPDDYFDDSGYTEHHDYDDDDQPDYYTGDDDLEPSDEELLSDPNYEQSDTDWIVDALLSVAKKLTK